MPNPADNKQKTYRGFKSERIPGAILALFMILLGIALLVLPSDAGQPVSDPPNYFISIGFIFVGVAFGYLVLGTQLRTTPAYIEYKGFLTKKKIEWERIESVTANSHGLLLVWYENVSNPGNKAADAKRKPKLIPLHLFVKNWWKLEAWEQHPLGHDIKAYAPQIFQQTQDMLYTEPDTHSQIPAIPLVTKIKRAMLVGVIGSFVLGMAGPWVQSASIPISIAFLTGTFIAEVAFQTEALSGNKIRLTSMLIAIGICTITGYLAGFWHHLLCQAVPFAHECNTGSIKATIFAGVFTSNLMVFVKAFASLFTKKS